MFNRKDSLYSDRVQPAISLSDDLKLFVILGILDALTSYINADIPGTATHFDIRQAFALMAFALLSRWWLAFAVAMIISASGHHHISFAMAFFGNLLFLIPTFAVVRLIHDRFLSHLTRLLAYGACWFLLVLFCYQAFTTPGIWSVLAVLRDEPIFPTILSGWREQPFFIESLLVGVISASAMAAIRAHRTLLQSRYELTTTLDSIGDGVIVTDLEGRVIRMNPVAQKLCGVAPKEALGSRLTDVFRIVNTKTMEPVTNPVQVVLEKGVTVGLANHTSLIARDGTVRQIADSAAPILLEGNRAIGAVMVFRDVTEEYKTREMLELTRDIIERSPVVAYTWENRKGWPVGYVSENVVRIFGYTAENLISGAVSYSEIIHPDDIERVEEEVQTAVADQDVEVIEHRPYRIITRSGEVKWVKDLMRIKRNTDRNISFDGILIDITALKQAEQQYIDLFTSSMDVVFISSVDGRILDINPAAEQVLGISLDELLSSNVKDLYNNPEDRGNFLQAIERDGFVKNFPITMKKSDGTPIDTIVSVVSVRAPDGKIVGFQGIAKDISELRKTQEQLFRAQKMEAIGTLAGGIAHDFNNILATILGYASFLKTKTSGNETLDKGLDAIEKSSVRAAELTSQLLSYTMRSTKEIKAIDLNQVIREVYRLISKTLDKSIELRLDLDDDIPSVEGDEPQLFQVIMNIVLNAQSAMANGGTFTIETGTERIDRPVEKDLFTIAEGSYVTMRCTDTGTGMDRETLLRVFEPYFTTRKDSGGSGLGMSVAFGIVKGHGGYIELESKPGKGTSVTVLLPASEKHAEASPDREAAVIGGMETILIIDDEEDVLDMTTNILSDNGYTVHGFNTGKNGIKGYSTHGADLVILDLKMPKMDGREVFAELKKINPDVAVLFSTGYAGPDLHQEMMAMGARGYLEKPFVVNKLLTKVRDVLDG